MQHVPYLGSKQWTRPTPDSSQGVLACRDRFALRRPGEKEDDVGWVVCIQTGILQAVLCHELKFLSAKDPYCVYRLPPGPPLFFFSFYLF